MTLTAWSRHRTLWLMGKNKQKVLFVTIEYNKSNTAQNDLWYRLTGFLQSQTNRSNRNNFSHNHVRTGICLIQRRACHEDSHVRPRIKKAWKWLIDRLMFPIKNWILSQWNDVTDLNIVFQAAFKQLRLFSGLHSRLLWFRRHRRQPDSQQVWQTVDRLTR